MSNVPYDKKSKKEKRKEDLKKRGSWNGVNPTSRVVPDKHKEQKRKEIENSRKGEY